MSLRGGVRVIGALAIAAAVWILLVAPGVRILAGTAFAIPKDQGLLAVAIEAPSSVARVYVDSRLSYPGVSDTIRIDFDVSYGDRTLPDEVRELESVSSVPPPLESVIRAIPEGAVPTFSVLLYGSLAESFIDCNDDLVNDEQVTYDELTDTEARAVVESLASRRGDFAPFGGDPDASLREWEVASDMEYVRLWPSVVYGMDQPREIWSDGEDAFLGYYNYFACTFSASDVWAADGAERVLRFPTVGFSGVGKDGEESSFSLRRDVEVVGSPVARILAADAIGELSDTGNVEFDSTTSDEIEDATPHADLGGVTARYEDMADRRRDQVQIFVAGVGAAVVAYLAVGVLKELSAAAVVGIVGARRRRSLAQQPRE